MQEKTIATNSSFNAELFQIFQDETTAILPSVHQALAHWSIQQEEVTKSHAIHLIQRLRRAARDAGIPTLEKDIQKIELTITAIINPKKNEKALQLVHKKIDELENEIKTFSVSKKDNRATTNINVKPLSIVPPPISGTKAALSSILMLSLFVLGLSLIQILFYQSTENADNIVRWLQYSAVGCGYLLLGLPLWGLFDTLRKTTLYINGPKTLIALGYIAVMISLVYTGYELAVRFLHPQLITVLIVG